MHFLLERTSNSPTLASFQGYLTLHTINFTYAQFDGLCKSIDESIRRADHHHFGRTSSERLLTALKAFAAVPDGEAKVLALDAIINHVIPAEIQMFLGAERKYDNLIYNQLAFQAACLSREVHDGYGAKVVKYFQDQTMYPDVVSSPSGRFVLDLSDRT